MTAALVPNPEPTDVAVISSVAEPDERGWPVTRATTVFRTARAPRRLRTRLTLVVSAIATVSIVATFSAIAYGLPRLLENALEDDQRGRVERIVSSIERTQRLPDTENFAQVFIPGDLGYQFFDRTGPYANNSLLTAAQLDLAMTGRTKIDTPIPELGGTARLFATPVDIGGKRLIVVVGSSLAEVERTRRLLLAALIAGGLALAILTTGGAWLLAGAALRPVQRMTDEAAAIANATEAAGAKSGLTRRLEIPPVRDEIAHLGATLNGLLDRVEESVERERAFVDDASHELRTPLAILRGELELATVHPGDEAEQQLLLSRLAREVNRLAALADDLLVLARARSGQTSAAVPIDILSIATRLIGRLPVDDVATRVSVHVNGDGSLALWRTDHAERVLMNLLDNARRHARSNVTVSIVRSAAHEPSSETVIVSVRDDGLGFPPNFLANAFERFATPDRARTRDRSGTGLGLAIVRELTEAADGTARVSNHPTGGAQVEVEIPAVVSE
jgi:two-component system, OmpR family, sensor kinase